MDTTQRKENTKKVWTGSGRLVPFEDGEDLREDSGPGEDNVSDPAVDSQSTRVLAFLDLPNECILMVFEKLSQEPRKLGKLMKVCKRFYDMCSSNPHLWRIADFRFPNREDYSMIGIDVFSRRKMYSQFLAQQRTRLTHLRLDCDILREFSSLCDLVCNCCSEELKYVEIKWASRDWSPIFCERNIEKLRYFRELLQKLAACSPGICFLNTEVDNSHTAVRMLGKLSNLNHLEVCFLDLELELETIADPSVRPIEIILFSLPKLKTFKVRLKENLDNELGGYVLKSKSLEHLDLYVFKNLHVNAVCLPKLHTLMVHTSLLKAGQTTQRRCCLFELIEEGCPSLTTFNGHHSIDAGLQNFNLTEDVKRDMSVCHCSYHFRTL